MKAMILAAGYGTRLRPLTYVLPKPLFPVCNKPIISYAVDRLLESGVTEIVVNLHHLPEAMESFLRRSFDCVFHFSREEEILGTGGGIRRVRWLLEGDGPFLVVNGDTIQAPPFLRLVESLKASDGIAALTLRHPPAGDRFTPVWYRDGKVTGFGSGSGEALMFSGAHALSAEVFALMPDEESFGIVEKVYEPMAKRGRIEAIVDDGIWFDVGTPQRYLDANASFRGAGCAIGSDASVADSVVRSVIGDRSVVAGDVADCVIWSDVQIAEGSRLRRCIVADGVRIREPLMLENAIVCRADERIPREAATEVHEGFLVARFG